MSHGSPFNSDWAEIIALVLLFVGIVMGVLSPSVWFTYGIALVAGLLSGRWWVRAKERGPGPYGLIMAGFIIGYVIGTFKGSRVLTFVLFMVAFIVMVKITRKGVYKDLFF
ncbi:MAG: hypothetical protein Q7S65_04170 [Nanoarchaeota archaeon]|nr:hypothetical protein [Nanoarchaeota archaeon]